MFANEDANAGESVHEPVTAEEPAQEDDRCDAHDLGSVATIGVNGTQMVADGRTFVEEDCMQATVADEESDFGAVECNEQNLDSMVVVEGDGGIVQMGFGERSSANGDYEQKMVMGEESVSKAKEHHSQDIHFSMEAEKEVSGTGGDSCDLRGAPNSLSHKAMQTLVFGRGMGPLSRKGWQKGLVGPVKYHPLLALCFIMIQNPGICSKVL